MSKKLEIIGKLHGRAFLKCKDRFYAIRQVETYGTEGGVQKQIIICSEIGSKKISKFQLKGYDLTEPYTAVVNGARQTGQPQVLFIEIETGEWRAFPITEELKQEFPFLENTLPT